ncbi:methylthioribose-1-phosphate isomerase [Leptopilina boulardi]|uniref:methylthioribose-1-phosphate isomerase n=1 Tax=Leptopilina boulardi TaxID=63433 RepID=UPI0021F66FF5|nr:methylthioribose-1-phosphate isomerase [Leptopilina boulardi]
MTLQAIKWEGRKLEILDQTLLPAISKYISVKGVEDGWKVINRMQVRGAPAIAIVGCLSLAAEIDGEIFTDKKVLRQEIEGKLNYLVSARPTAVNIKLAAEYLIGLANKLSEDNEVSPSMMKDQFLKTIETMLEKDLADNNAIGKYGSEEILKSVPNDALVRVITHCNTGSLATAGYGTALGVIRSLHGKDRLEQVYCTETRPFNQGARLTSYELVHDKIPGVLICDDMVASLMKSRTINAVIVGADRVVANGDTANKIGTYQIAILAKYHGVPFYVAAPCTSIDFNMNSGDQIKIEERPEEEITHILSQRIAASGIQCWNPAFDVTPAELITGIITEKGVYKPNNLSVLKEYCRNNENQFKF